MAHILIVDDDDIVRRALELAVARMGHEPRGVASGALALEAARERRPDLALVDLTMPGMDGIELVARLGTTFGERRPPVVFVSAIPAEEAGIEGAQLAGVAGYVRKPFLLGELVRAVRAALAGAAGAPPQPAPTT